MADEFTSVDLTVQGGRVDFDTAPRFHQWMEDVNRPTDNPMEEAWELNPVLAVLYEDATDDPHPGVVWIAVIRTSVKPYEVLDEVGMIVDQQAHEHGAGAPKAISLFAEARRYLLPPGLETVPENWDEIAISTEEEKSILTVDLARPTLHRVAARRRGSQLWEEGDELPNHVGNAPAALQVVAEQLARAHLNRETPN